MSQQSLTSDDRSRILSRRRKVAAVVAVLAVAVLTAVVIFREPVATQEEPRQEEQQSKKLQQKPPVAIAQRPMEVASDGYVSSRACRECHESQYHSWHSSYHRTMTQVASPNSVMGPFDGRVRKIDDVALTFRRKGDEFWVDANHLWMRGAAKTPVSYQMVLTTGSHHMQVCWVSESSGIPATAAAGLSGAALGQPQRKPVNRALGIVPLVYVKEMQRWVPRRSVFLQPPHFPLTLEPARWNIICIKCHTTHGVPGISGQETYTRVAEFGISCEACHGPGESHIKFHKQKTNTPAPLVHPAKISHERSSQVCGQCHSVFDDPQSTKDRFFKSGFAYRPGDELTKSRRLSFNSKDHSTFWSDGMVRVSGREYTGLSQSPCYLRGEISCLSCHRLHKPKDDPRPMLEWANDQLDHRRLGNQACLQCHPKYKEPVKLTAHTHHPADSHGSSCYNCHMPHTTYGLVKAIRSHKVDSPNVGVTLKTGRPNACNLCHLDKSLQWTADNLKQWYGIAQPDVPAGRRNIASAAHWALTGDAGQRALIAWHMGWKPAQQVSGSNWLAPYLAELMTDPYDAVRYVAYRSLRTLPGFERFKFDFVADEATRKATAAKVVPQWKNQPKKPIPFHERVLLTKDAAIRSDDWRRLLESRTNKPVYLAE